jgi:mono/diheme cytochrome c family protein
MTAALFFTSVLLRAGGGVGVSPVHATELRRTAAPIQPGEKTLGDGVFTEEQATRGRQRYREHCSVCHSTDLSGGGDGEPGLVGTTFMAQWRQRSVSELFAYVSERMPYSAPGKLQSQDYIDIVSFVLKENGAPIGAVELPSDPEQLKQILITESPAKPQ